MSAWTISATQHDTTQHETRAHARTHLVDGYVAADIVDDALDEGHLRSDKRHAADHTIRDAVVLRERDIAQLLIDPKQRLVALNV